MPNQQNDTQRETATSSWSPWVMSLPLFFAVFALLRYTLDASFFPSYVAAAGTSFAAEHLIRHWRSSRRTDVTDG